MPRSSSTSRLRRQARAARPQPPPESDEAKIAEFAKTNPELAAKYEHANASANFNPQSPDFRDPSPVHAPWIVVLLWALIGGYGWIVSVVTDSPIWLVPLYYAGMMIAFVFWHWLAHESWTGVMYEIHTNHHWSVFPPNRLYGHPALEIVTNNQLFDIGYGDLRHEGPLYVMITALLGVGYALGVNWIALLMIAIMMALLGGIGVALHTSFHILGFPLERYEWYCELRALHFIHHVAAARHNYAVFNFFIDKLIGRFYSCPEAAKEASARETKAVMDAKRAKRLAAKQSTSRTATSTSDEEAKDEDDGNDDEDVLMLPAGVDEASLRAASAAGGLAALVLGGHTGGGAARVRTSTALQRGTGAVMLRVVVIAIGIWAWFETQQAIGARTKLVIPETQHAVIADEVMGWTQHWFEHLQGNQELADSVIFGVAALADIAGIATVTISAASKTVRVIASLAILVAIRQSVQFLVELPVPAGSLWRQPHNAAISHPPMFVNWDIDNDIFFAMPPAILLLLAIEAWPGKLAAAGVQTTIQRLCSCLLVALSTASGIALVTLRANWTLSVIVGWIVAVCASLVATRWEASIEMFLP